jgi:hypothetical protein
MKIIRDKISLKELQEMSQKMFGGLVKAVVDVQQEIMVVDAGLHADEEALLLEEENSQQEHLWGINLFPQYFGTEKLVIFDSMINLRPSQGNMSRSVENREIQKKIRSIVQKLVHS